MERTRIDPFNPPPPDFEITGTAKQRAILELFRSYELLPTSYILTKTGKNRQTIWRLNRGHYIGVCKEEGSLPMDARNREIVWKILPRGEKLVGGEFPHTNDHFKHRLMRSLIQFSFDLAADEIPNLSKRTLADVLAHDDCPPETRLDPNPSHIPIDGTVLIPDADLFGYEYLREHGRKRWFYLHGFEADRGTERYRSNNRGKTVARMLKQYAVYLDSFMDQTRYGLANIYIPIICKSQYDVDAYKREVAQLSPAAQEHILFKVLLGFDNDHPKDHYPPPTPWAVTEDWQTAGGEPLNILRTLKGN